MSACREPVPSETLVAYWADDLPPSEVDRVDEHLMGCAACTATSERIARIARAIREAIPPMVSAAKVEALRARGVRIRENVVQSTERRVVFFGKSDEIVLHRLVGLDLSDVERVGVKVIVEGTDQVLLTEPEAPFEPDAGEILVACQRHFAGYPPNIVFEVRARTRSGEERVTSFAVPHVFE